MEMLINDTVLIAEIQKEFNREFNFLKLEFYMGMAAKAGNKKAILQNSDLKVGDCRRIRKDGRLLVAKTQTVCEVEDALARDFGLSAHVLRHSGNLWIETRHSSKWTLEKQNEVGRELSSNKQNIAPQE